MLDRENDVLMELPVQRELSGLSEGLIAAWEVALEGFLARMDVSMLLQILCEGEALEAKHADVLLDLLVGREVAPQRESGGVGLVAANFFAKERSLHARLKKL